MIYACRRCAHEFIFPLPTGDEVAAYYDESYFTVRTERGYNDYFSEETKKQIIRVFDLNLKDIAFPAFEHTLPPTKRSLDIGCAAGYFVELLKKRGWNATGIDISSECALYAKKNLELDVVCGDYLTTRYPEPFDLITMWATVEHLPRPDLFLKKASTEIFRSGRLYLSTCRSDSAFKKLHGKKWRYYNVPEHIHYFSNSSLSILLESCGFSIDRLFTYGSGLGKGGTPLRRAADILAKRMRLGDMVVVSAWPR